MPGICKEYQTAIKGNETWSDNSPEFLKIKKNIKIILCGGEEMNL